MEFVRRKLIVLFLILLLLSSCSKKDISSKEENELPAEETSTGISFSKDEDLELVSSEGKVYILGDRVRELDFDGGKLIDTEYKSPIYQGVNHYYSFSEGVLSIQEAGSEKVVDENIVDLETYEDKLIYSNSKGVFILDYARKIPQLIRENIQGETPYSLEDFSLMDGGKYVLFYDHEDNVTEIYLSETLEHVLDFDGRVSSTSWNSDSFLFEDQENLNRIGYYQISSEEVSKFSLTTKDERVLASPSFDKQGMVRFISDKEGIFSLNKLDPQTQMVRKINMMKTEDLLQESLIDGVYVFQFKNYFYYSYDDNDYHFYALESDSLNFSDELIYVSKGQDLKVVKKDNYKTYSLKGKPVESLATGSEFYYTYVEADKKILDRIKIDF